jgi:hypothetical protein
VSIRHGSTLALLLGGLAVAAAGCGDGSGSPGVANLGTNAGTTSTSTTAPPVPGSGGSPGSGSGVVLMMSGGKNASKFSQCMRAHGVSNFPDPNGQGQIQVGGSSGVDPTSPTFGSARQACQKLIGGGTATPAQQARARQQSLAFSACMRRHGVPDFPDPTFVGGSVRFRMNGGANSDLNSTSPTFQAAQHACGGFGRKRPATAPPGGGK